MSVAARLCSPCSALCRITHQVFLRVRLSQVPGAGHARLAWPRHRHSLRELPRGRPSPSSHDPRCRLSPRGPRGPRSAKAPSQGRLRHEFRARATQCPTWYALKYLRESGPKTFAAHLKDARWKSIDLNWIRTNYFWTRGSILPQSYIISCQDFYPSFNSFFRSLSFPLNFSSAKQYFRSIYFLLV